MNRKEKYKEELIPILKRFFKSGERRELYAYIIGHSNLPGPRANLELAGAFTDLVEEHATEDTGRIWGWLNAMMAFSPEVAPDNDPKEFLPFCGVWGMAAMTSACPQFLKAALGKLKALSEDKRWRIWLIMRAVAAGVAEPILLKQRQIAKASFELHRKILSTILSYEERNTEAFRILRKALGYTLSVITESEPAKGFSYLDELAKSGDSDLRWIVNENLKKNRLIKNFPDEVKTLKRAMEK